MLRLGLFRALCLLPCLTLSHVVEAEWLQHDFDVMGTRAHIEFWVSPELPATTQQWLRAEVVNDIAKLFGNIEQGMSPYIADSEVSQINRMAVGEVMPLSKELLGVLQRAQHFSQLTDGAFDITYASVGYLYDYRQGHKPSASVIAKSLAAIDYRAIELDAEAAELRVTKPDVRIDLGGIAKGYAVDRAILILQEAGVRHALISIGGDSRLLGSRKNTPWMVGIRHPREPDKYALRIPLEQTAISTSGDYERYFFDAADNHRGEKLPRRIHHILNPDTGRSAYGVVSATVIGPSSIDCDALSTSLFVLGVRRGIELIETLAGFDAILIDVQGKVHYSSGLLATE